eukprot:8700990-Prorocentrum_lima.AAC.1
MEQGPFSQPGGLDALQGGGSPRLAQKQRGVRLGLTTGKETCSGRLLGRSTEAVLPGEEER